MFSILYDGIIIAQIQEVCNMIHLLLAIIYISFISLGLPDSLLGSVWPTVYPEFQVPISYAGIVSMITFGIYGLVVMSAVSTDINTIAGRYDGKKTTHYLLMAFLFSWLTLGIAPLVWYHKISARIGNELIRRNLNYRFGAGSFWGWSVLGSLLFGIGPLVYTHKLLKSMNLLSGHYNYYG